MQDPPRPGVKEAIETCKQAGINIIMITGDVKETAESIGEQIGIISKNSSSNSFSGKEFFALSDQKQLEILKNNDGLIFSRTEPVHKRLLVQKLSDLD